MWNIKTFYNNQHKLTLIWFLNVQVAVHYYGRLAAKQGWRFDSTYDHKDETGEPIPFVFTLGSGKVSLMVFQFFFMCIPLISCLWVAKRPHVANTRHAMLMVCYQPMPKWMGACVASLNCFSFHLFLFFH